jgi:tRNA pseudouridine55 synthase
VTSPSVEPFGLLAVMKPPGMTSHDVVSRVRKVVGTRRVGHGGTLDPAAAGVMLVAVGKATRLLRFLDDKKAYIAEVVMGLGTDSGDLEGALIATADASALTVREVLDVLPAFSGLIRQKPPLTSAVHVNGKRLYEYAHRGETLDEALIPEREVLVSRLEMREFLPGPRATIRLEIDCSAGTYIRSLAMDLGARLGLPAVLSFLLRTRAGGAISQESQTLEELAVGVRWLSLDIHLAHLPARILEPSEVADVGHGRTVGGEYTGFVRLLDPTRKLVAVGEGHAGVVQPVVVF